MNNDHRDPQHDPMRGPLTAYVDSRTTDSVPPPVVNAFRAARLRRRNRLTALVSLAAAAAVVAAIPVAAATLGGDRSPTTGQATTSRGVMPNAEAPQRSGPVSMSEPAGCFDTYTPASAMANAAFAFDGTVKSVENVGSSTDLPSGDLMAVRFTVNAWYVGAGDTNDVVVALGTSEQIDQAAGYEPGTRLLVSGDPLPSGSPEYIAWGCGFTRYYDAETASQWKGNAG
jgi:hypothetical protein